MTNKKQKVDKILKIARENDIDVPAELLIKLGKLAAQDLINAIDILPEYWESTRLTGLIPYQNLPVFGLKTPGIVPAPNKLGLVLWSHGWDIPPPVRNIYTNVSGGGGRRTTGGGGGVTQHSLLTQLDYATAGHTGFQPALTGAATLALLLPVDGAGSLLDSDFLDGNHAAAFSLVGHLHAGVYEPVDPTIVRTTDANYIDLTDGGSTNLHIHPAHDILSAYHGDTLAGAVADGSIIIGNVTPKWSTLAITVPAANVRNVLGVDNAELRPSWKVALDATNPVTITAAGAAAPGTSLVFSHRDHVHDITVSPTLLGNGAMQYQTIITGAAPFVPVYSGFLLDGTTGGKTVFAVTNTKTLTLTSTGDFNLTVPATGTAALLATANVFTAIQKINVNNALALLVEQDGVKDNTFIVDTANGRVGVGIAPASVFHVFGVDPEVRIVGNSGNNAILAFYNNASRYGVLGIAIFADQLTAGSAIGDVVLINNATQRIMFNALGAGGVSALVVQNARVGCGIITPLSRFHIVGSEDVIQLQLVANATQTANLFTCETSTNVVLHSVSVTGITSILSTVAGALVIGAGTAGIDYNITFDGETNDGVITWMEDEARFDLDSNSTTACLRLLSLDGANDYADLWVDSDSDLHIAPNGVNICLGKQAADVDYSLYFMGQTNIGYFTWKEDEDYFQFADTVILDLGLVVNETGNADGDFRAESDNQVNMLFLDASADILYHGGTTNGTRLAANGDQSFIGTAGFYPRILSQATKPAAGTGATGVDTSELVVWDDSDGTEIWLVFNDAGTVKGIKVETI